VVMSEKSLLWNCFSVFTENAAVAYNPHKNITCTLHIVLYNTDPCRRAILLKLTVIQLIRTCPQYMSKVKVKVSCYNPGKAPGVRGG
jgi:hypothetical protein